LKRTLILPALVLALTGAGAAAQEAPVGLPADQTQQDASDVEGVVVTARRIGVPVWRVGDADSAIVFVGGIGAIPKDVAWRAGELEAAVAGSRKVLHSAALDATLGDLYRLMFKRGRWTDLPKGESLNSRIDPALQARLAKLEAAGKLPNDYQELRPWYAANSLRRRLVRSERGLDDGDTAWKVARRAAARNKIPTEPALKRSFKTVIEDAATQRATDVACLEASAGAVEAGPDAVRRRASAWTRSRIAEVLDAPLTRAEGLCWPEGEADLGPQLRQAWREVAKRELARPGAVVAVVPLRYLAEPGGLLDDLEAQGYAIQGPRWRAATP
jgi:hypothetical protein